MTDWKSEHLDTLFDQIEDLNLVNPEEVEHPSQRELNDYVQDQLSPFLKRSMEEHLVVCESCVGYLTEAFEHKEAERDTTDPTLTARMVDNVSPMPSTWQRRLRPLVLTAAAVWLPALPLFVWFSNHFTQQPTLAFAETRLLKVAPAAQQVSDKPPAAGVELGDSKGLNSEEIEVLLREVRGQQDFLAQAIQTLEELDSVPIDLKTADAPGSADWSDEQKQALFDSWLDSPNFHRLADVLVKELKVPLGTQLVQALNNNEPNAPAQSRNSRALYGKPSPEFLPQDGRSRRESD